MCYASFGVRVFFHRANVVCVFAGKKSVCAFKRAIFDKSSRIWFVKIGSVGRSVGCNSVAWHVMRSPVSVHFSLLFPAFAKLCDQTKRSKSNQLGALRFLLLLLGFDSCSFSSSSSVSCGIYWNENAVTIFASKQRTKQKTTIEEDTGVVRIKSEENRIPSDWLK